MKFYLKNKATGIINSSGGVKTEYTKDEADKIMNAPATAKCFVAIPVTSVPTTSPVGVASGVPKTSADQNAADKGKSGKTDTKK